MSPWKLIFSDKTWKKRCTQGWDCFFSTGGSNLVLTRLYIDYDAIGRWLTEHTSSPLILGCTILYSHYWRLTRILDSVKSVESMGLRKNPVTPNAMVYHHFPHSNAYVEVSPIFRPTHVPEIEMIGYHWSYASSISHQSYSNYNGLVAYPLHSSKKYEFVNWDDEIPNWMEK